MSPLTTFIWALARVLIAAFLAVLVDRGWITNELAAQLSPDLINGLVILIGFLGLALHAVWLHRRRGLTPGSPYPPSNLLGVTQSTASINASPQMVDARNLPVAAKVIAAVTPNPPKDPIK